MKTSRVKESGGEWMKSQVSVGGNARLRHGES